MGCIQSVRQRSKNSTSLARKTPAEKIEFVEPDPDYRWAQVSLSMLMNNSFQMIMNPSCDDLQDWVMGSHPELHQRTDLNYPFGWTVFCINARTGKFYRINLVKLAINISVRAEQLAQAFGVVSGDLLDTDEPPKRTSKHSLEPLHERIRRPIYAALHTPDFGWTLLDRNVKKAVKQQQDKLRSSKAHVNDYQETFKLPPPNVQLLQSGTGRKFYVDTPTVGMNIAEQLYRLERKQENRNFVPSDTFGWEILNENSRIEPNQLEVHVRNAQGEIKSLVPEEMVMNVTQWVQQTYLTSVEF